MHAGQFRLREKTLSNVLGWVRGHALASTAMALVLGIGIGSSGSEASSSSSEDSELVADLRAQLTEAQAAVDSAEDRADDTIENMREELQSEAEELDDLARALDKRERELKGAERVAAKARIDDGVWQVGKEITPGTYRAPGGGSCYWALLGSADTSDISNNGGFGPNQTVTLSSGWFESRDCGTWQKIG